MSNCTPYSDEDSGVIKEYLSAAQGTMEEPVVLKIYQGIIAGDPTKGISKTFSWKMESSTAVISSVSQNDLVYSGGIYQLGDIKVQLRRLLQEIDDKAQTPGDRLVWQGHEYRIVGKVATHYISGYVLYDYSFRRV